MEVIDPKLVEGIRLAEYALGPTPNSKQCLTPSQISHFHSLLSDPLVASGYLSCLIAKLISLDSLHGYKPIKSVLYDLLQRHQFNTQDGYKEWLEKAPTGGGSNLLSPFHVVRSNLIDTVCFVGWLFSCTVTDTLRTLWRQWQIACSTHCRSKSEKMALHLVGSIVNSSQLNIRDIVSLCCQGFKAGHFLPDFLTHKESSPDEVAGNDHLLYARLRKMARTSESAKETLQAVIDQLERLEFNEEDEQVFPVLQLFCETVMAAPYVHQEHYFNAYRAVQPLYLWPLPHCDVARDVMNFIQDEMKSPGIHFRRRLISEHNLNVKQFLSHGDREHSIHVLVDTSAIAADSLYSSLAHQECLTETHLQQLLIKHTLLSYYGTNCNLADVEEGLSLCAADGSIESLCNAAVQYSEQAAGFASEEKALDVLGDRLESLMGSITSQVAKSNESSAMATNGCDDKETVAVALPRPCIERHTFNSEESTSAHSSLFEILFKSDYFDMRPRNSISPPTCFDDGFNVRANSTGSRTSYDSLGSSFTLEDTPPSSILPEIKEETEAGFENEEGGKCIPHCCVSSSDTCTDVRCSSCVSCTSLDSTGSSAVYGTPDVNRKSHLAVESDLPLVTSAGEDVVLPNILVVEPSRELVARNTSLSVLSVISEITAKGEHNDKQDYEQHALHATDQHSASLQCDQTPTLLEVPLRHSTCQTVAGEIPVRKGITSIYEYQDKVKAGADRSLLQRSRLLSLDETERSKPSLFKIVVAGPDQGINSVASAYADIRATHSIFFEKAEVRFYYLPLSARTKTSDLNHTLGASKRLSLPKVLGRRSSWSTSTDHCSNNDKISKHCAKNWLADFMAKIDGWHVRHVTSAVTRALNVLPHTKEREGDHTKKEAADEKDLENVEHNTTPFGLVQDSIVGMCRFARYKVGIKLYSVRIWQHGNDQAVEPSSKLVMVQRLEVLGAGQLRYLNEFTETRNQLSVLHVTGSLVTVDGHHLGPFTLPDKSYWSLTISNIPRPGDTCVANPETSGLELALVQGVHLPLRIGFKGRRSGPKDEKEVLHVNEVQVTSQKPFNVVIDNGEPLTVMRLQVKPCCCPALPHSTYQTVHLPLGGSNPDDFVYLSRRRGLDRQAGSHEEIEFPLMTFWPACL